MSCVTVKECWSLPHPVSSSHFNLEALFDKQLQVLDDKTDR